MTEPERVEEATRSYLEEYPQAEDNLATVVTVDAESSGWTFDEIPLDSGQFGELVSRNIAEQTSDDTYTLVDNEAVERVLNGESTPDETKTTAIDTNLSLPTVDSRIVGPLVVALAVIAITRSLFYSAVFRNGNVISPANDPYFYRHYQRELLELSSGVTDFGTLSEIEGFWRIRSRPLTGATNWWFAELFGGTQGAADTAAAWLPVLMAVILGVVLYFLVIKLTDDHRIAFASLLLLALTPVHVIYTSLGFLEHRPYQYFWLTVMAFALVWLALDVQRRQTINGQSVAMAHIRTPQVWVMTAVLAVAVAASVHTWGGSPLTFVPVVVYLSLRVIADVRAEIPPLLAVIPTVAGIGGGAILAIVAHLSLGWHEPIAVATPVLVAGGGVGVGLLATAWRQLDLPPAGLLATEVVVGVLGLFVYSQLRPGDIARFQNRMGDLLGRDSATETASLFATDQAVLLGPLTQIGVGFYLALVALGVATWYVYRQYEPAWLVLVCFTWYYMLLAAIQVRFAAQLSIFIAIFGGVALVYLLAKLELARGPTVFASASERETYTMQLPEERTRGGVLVGVVVLVLALNLIFVPTLLGQIHHSDEKVEGTMAIAEHADSLEHSHPDFVLSEWSDSRLHNYFVSGQAEEYGYAQDNFEEFISDRDPDSWYENEFAGGVGYVVLTETEAPQGTVQSTLFDELGAGNDTTAHYKLLYASGEVRVFVALEGATIETTATPNETVTAQTDITVMDQSFSYERTETADENGTVQIRVAYPGEYDLGGETVTVTEEDIYQGNKVAVDN